MKQEQLEAVCRFMTKRYGVTAYVEDDAIDYIIADDGFVYVTDKSMTQKNVEKVQARFDHLKGIARIMQVAPERSIIKYRALED